jgi:hypothetical protein
LFALSKQVRVLLVVAECDKIMCLLRFEGEGGQ